MIDPDPAAPPRLARWLLRRALDGPARSAIVGDIDEEFERFIVPERGLRKARRWYWQQALASIAACARGAAVANREPDEPVSAMRDMMHDSRGLGSDARAAVRFCLRSPLTSMAVVVTLAIGVGASTAVFSLLNAALFKRLPIAHADRLVLIRSKTGGAFSFPEGVDIRNVSGLSAVVAGGRTSVTMGEGNLRRRVTVDLVSANYFEALGTAPAYRGRLLAAADDQPGSAPVAVVSHAFWRRELSAAPIVGTSVKLKQGFFTIAGIAPDGFTGTHAGFSPDFWIPLTHAPMMEGHRRMLEPGAGWLGVMGILERPNSLPAAQAALTAQWRAAGTRDDAVLTPMPRGTSVFDNTRATVQLRIFAMFVTIILMIACLNVATLLGGVVQERRKELAIRSSLGAGRVRLLRQLLLEHLLLAAGGGIVGGIVGVWLARGLAALIAGPYMPGDLDVRADLNVVLFTVLLSIVVALVVGLMPAIRWSRINTLIDLQGSHAGMGRLLRSTNLWALIPLQVALGTVLLSCAGALAKTVHELKLGIVTTSPERVWFANLYADASMTTQGTIDDFTTRLRRHLQTLPGAETAALATNRPLASSRRGPLRVEGMTTVPESRPMPFGGPPPPPPPPARGGGKPKRMLPPSKMWLVSNNYVSPGFFAALALPIVRGREFNDGDVTAGQKVAVVNETLAARAFGKGDPIGRRVAWADSETFDIVIVGVVRDLRSEHLRQSAPDAIFFPLTQVPFESTLTPTPTGGRDSIDLTVVLRAAEAAPLGSKQLLGHALAFDSRLFVDRVWTFDEEAGRSLTLERLLVTAGTVLGGIALLLLVVGLYGTLAAAVARGRRELGIRLALGASPGSVRTMVIARGLVVALAGLVLGLPLSYVSTRSFAHLLYGVRPVEPLVVGAIVGIVLATAALSAYLPARRAARVDPLVALRTE